MNKKELREKLDIPSSMFTQLISEGLPSENDNGANFNIDYVVDWMNSRNKQAINNLVVGNEYRNNEISDVFGCSPQGGMRRSHKTNTLVLFTDHTGKNVYEDKWEGDILHYTGMGLEGDQDVNAKQNRILKNSNFNYVRVFLFETFADKQHTFVGQMKLVEDPYMVTEKDRLGQDRNVYKFPIQIMNQSFKPKEEKLNNRKKNAKKVLVKLTTTELKDRAYKISKQNKHMARNNHGNRESYRYLSKKEYARDPYIAEYVKTLANGICQLCDESAPFWKNGKPYLHSHHIDYLANGGIDTVDNCIAVCPNCHAKIHELENKQDKDKLLVKVRNRRMIP